MDGPGEKHVTATGRPMNQSAKIAAMQNGNYELFDWRQSNQSLNQETIEIVLILYIYRAFGKVLRRIPRDQDFTRTSKLYSIIRLRKPNYV